MKPPRIEVERRDDVALVRFNDTIEVYHAESIKELIVALITDEKYKKIIFVLREVPFVDSSGLGVFINLSHRFNDQIDFRFCDLSENVRAVFRYANVLNYFAIDETEEESLHALRSPG